MRQSGYHGHHRHHRGHGRRRVSGGAALRRRRWLLYSALFALSVGASFLLALHIPHHWQPHPAAAVDNPGDNLFDARASYALDPASTGGHPVYPYSVIAGGARSPQELKASIARDPVVAAHYADFDVARARVVRSDSERLLYASYRIRNEVFWSKKRLKIPKGEQLLTDGIHYARARCGNRLSPSPQERISAYEPTQQAMETPVPAQPPLLGPPIGLPGGPPALAELEGPEPPPPAPAGAAGGFPPGGTYVIPPGPPAAQNHGGGPPPLGGIIIPTPPGAPPKRKHQKGKQPPPPPVPEPGTVLLVSSGLGWLAYRKKSKNK